jgi:hypothetical protein
LPGFPAFSYFVTHGYSSRTGMVKEEEKEVGMLVRD